MSLQKSLLIILAVMMTLSILVSCAGTTDAVVMEEEKQSTKVAAAEKPAPEPEKPKEWIARVADAEVKVGTAKAAMPKAYEQYELLLRAPEQGMFELVLLAPGAEPAMLLIGESSLMPDEKGRIAFHVLDIDEGNVQPVFDVLGLSVLSKDRLREAYFLHGVLEPRGISTLAAYDMGRTVVIKFVAQ